MRKYLFILPLVSLALIPSAHGQVDPSTAKPPVAKMVPHATTIHGDKRIDDYHWLREKSNKEVIAHLEAENAYTAAVTKGIEPFQDKIYKEILGRIKQTDLSVPYKERGYFYYTRTEEGKQYPIFCRKLGSLNAKEEVYLDANELGKGQKFFSVADVELSDDGHLLAYATDLTGFREVYLSVKDLRDGKLLLDRTRKTSNVVWAADNKTLFYVTPDESKRPYRLYRHVLGTDKDELIYEEKDELYRISVRRSRDRKFIFASSASALTSEVRTLPADRPDGAFKLVLPREDGHEYSVDHRDGLFYIRTNKDAKNFKIVTAPVDDPTKGKPFIPHRPEVLLGGITLFAKYAVIGEREQGVPHLVVHDFETGKSHRITFPEPIYSAFGSNNPDFDSTIFRFNYQSMVTPSSVFDYDFTTRERTLLKQEEVSGYDPARYQSERIFATATDGTKIPISLVYRKDIKRDGTAPLLLTGYGAYGAAGNVGFSALRLSLLDRGVVFAQAHIRGGNDLGEAWHEGGKMMNKKNTFTDFIACADHLVKEKYTSHQRIAIQGGSAGGLLIGAVVNLRPDLCKVAVLQVPFVDVINTMLDASLPLTAQEFIEWGNPKIKSEYDYMKSYCPYTNVTAKDYPAMLVTTSLNDSQVMYWEPAKYVAKMRATKTDKNPLVFKINMAGGHGGSSGRYDRFKEQAFVMAFVCDQVGVKP